MTRLDEAGMLRHDLDHLIIPLIDIDVFESKIDNARAVVLAFYVTDQEPARDLERFIERGPIDVLDTETSPAPTDDGYYVVFVEMDRDQDLPKDIMEIMDAVNNLTDVESWRFKTYGDPEPHDLTEEELRERVNLDPSKVPPSQEDVEDEIGHEDAPEAEEEPEAKEEPMLEMGKRAIPFLRDGLMESISVADDLVTLGCGPTEITYRVQMIGRGDPSIPVVGLEIGNPLISESNRLGRILGPTYAISVVDGGLLVECTKGYLLLGPID